MSKPDHGPAPCVPSPRQGTGERIAVIDIGSNSIRLVVYDEIGRNPYQLFNERVLCALGRTVQLDGKLNPEGVEIGLQTLIRFAALIENMGIHQVEAVATAAIREAADGDLFLARVRDATGLPVRLIDGAEEARLAALGVLSGTPEATGAVGDLGGGSLELTVIGEGGIGTPVTVPLGPLSLMALDLSREALIQHIDRQLLEIGWLKSLRGETLYAVGGAWRSIAKAHMAFIEYPLHIIHHYEVRRRSLQDFAGLISMQSRSSLEKTPGISRRRIDTIPLAAQVMARLLAVAKPARVVFSAYGLRDGLVYDRLDAAARREDPLQAAAEHLARRTGRFASAKALDDWIAPLFPEADEEHRRLRGACCLMSDLGWAEHPDYRAEHAAERVMRMPFAAIDHPGRAFLGLAIQARYAGNGAGPATTVAARLLDERRIGEARAIGLALRLAYSFTGGALGLLARARLVLEADALALAIAGADRTLYADVVGRRLVMLARALDRDPVLRLGNDRPRAL